jgi:inhibitor of cysteine peptidase
MQKLITVLGVLVAVLLIIVGVTFVLAPASGSLPASHIVNLTENATGTTITIHVGDEIQINLQENPSTGYQWNYSVPDAFSVTEDKYIAMEGSGLVGQSGTHVWLLKAEKKGKYELNWIYKRSWESTASDRPFNVTVKIG